MEKKWQESDPIMNHTKTRFHLDQRKIVIFGAGKIGRSFIGQLFGRGGYRVVFVDVDPVIVDLLNTRRGYRVVIKGDKDQEISVNNVQAISGHDTENVAEAVASAGILAVSVGKNAIEKVIPNIALGLKMRYQNEPYCSLDIIIAENMRDASDFMKEQLKANLPPDFPVDTLVGLVETSIGKMVPIMTSADLEKDPLVVFAEPYNTLILDGKGFKSPIPDIKGLAPKENIKAWVDRKAFIHNLGHATAAYYGYYKHPEAIYMFEILEDKEVYSFTREAMVQSAFTLSRVYPHDYTFDDLLEHIDDLLRRFCNKALKDTIYRVGSDLIRKLSTDDRFMGALHLADLMGTPRDKILKAMSYGLFFDAKDETGDCFPADIKFLDSIKKDFELAFTELLDFNPAQDRQVILKLKDAYSKEKVEVKKTGNDIMNR
jgi:mannitol-1-phosphate 5-dehydrogenase